MGRIGIRANGRIGGFNGGIIYNLWEIEIIEGADLVTTLINYGVIHGGNLALVGQAVLSMRGAAGMHTSSFSLYPL